MKIWLKKNVLWLLKCMAKLRLKRKKILIIGVTGSIGKTSTKEAIANVLAEKFSVFQSQKSFNTEFGVPLTILQQKSGFSSTLAWFLILVKSLFVAFRKPSYDILILEMGVDKRGDMSKLLKIVSPKIAVFTGVAPVHLDKGQFPSLQAIFAEKMKLCQAVPVDGLVILDAKMKKFKNIKNIKAKTVFYETGSGHEPAHSIAADNIKYFYKNGIPAGLKFEVRYKHKIHDFQTPIIGTQHVKVILPAIMCGLELGMSLEDCELALSNFKFPPGRMSLISGINGSLILDSSYNASPNAMEAALITLNEFGKGKFKPKRKIVVLGSMNELGANAKKYHVNIGEMAAKVSDLIITVGDQARWYKNGACQNGFSDENFHHFSTAKEAGNFLKSYLSKGDLILVKGSQNNVRLEQCVKIIMAEPEKASKLLVRQENSWKT